MNLINDISRKVQRGYFNVFVFLLAAPIVGLSPKLKSKSSPNPELEVSPAGFPIRLPSFFKNNIMEALKEKEKLMYLKFESLTKDNLVDTLKNGCRVLHLTCHVIDPEGDFIIIEDSVGRPERISYKELKEIFAPSKPNMNNSYSGHNSMLIHENEELSNEGGINVLILGSKNDRKTAKFFFEELKIPHVIIFEFTNTEKDLKHKLYEDTCIEKFTEYFLKEIIGNSFVGEAYQKARTDTLKFLSNRFGLSNDSSTILNLIGFGPLLYPHDADQEKGLFGYGQDVLIKGIVNDVSKVCPTNIGRLVAPFTGRNNEMVQVLSSATNFIRIIGETGVGKTAFALQLANFFLDRNVYTDGVFYFGLKRLKLIGQDLIDAMKDVFGAKFVNNMDSFFKDKKMLLIFDNFGIFYRKELVFPSLIFVKLREFGIKTIVLTRSNYKQTNLEISKAIGSESLEIQLKPLINIEMAHIYISLSKVRPEIDYDIESTSNLPLIINCNGNPKKLIDLLNDNGTPSFNKQIDVESSHFDWSSLSNLSTRENPKISVNAPRHYSQINQGYPSYARPNSANSILQQPYINTIPAQSDDDFRITSFGNVLKNKKTSIKNGTYQKKDITNQLLSQKSYVEESKNLDIPQDLPLDSEIDYSFSMNSKQNNTDKAPLSTYNLGKLSDGYLSSSEDQSPTNKALASVASPSPDILPKADSSEEGQDD